MSVLLGDIILFLFLSSSQIFDTDNILFEFFSMQLGASVA